MTVVRKTFARGGGALLIALLAQVGVGATQNSPFAAANTVADQPAAAGKAGTDDPFSSSKRRTDEIIPQNARASRSEKPRRATPIDDRIDYEVNVTPQRARRGEVVTLTVTGAPRPGYHTYPLTQRSSDPAQDPSGLSSLRYDSSLGLQPLWPVTESDPQVKIEEGVGVLLEHTLPFTWTQDILILPETTPGSKTLAFTLKQQVCNGNCVWGEPQFELMIDVADGPPVPLSAALQERMKARPPDIRVVPVGGAAANAEPAPRPKDDLPKSLAKENRSVPAEMAAEPGPRSGSGGLWAFVLQGMLWGAISLLTPCVFPMIPITVSFFLKQSEKEHHRPLQMALVYSATIVLVLTAGAVLLLKSFQDLSQHWLTNVALGLLFLVFAFSLFGMYEIRLPAGLANYTSSQQSRGGTLGTVFMALTFTIISFTCVAPFLGGFAGINIQSRPFIETVSGGLAFSVTFASPFFLLAIFPTLLKQMPKSGSWMNALKVVMGFLELAAALKFLRTAELLYLGKGQLLTYDLVLGMYVALAILCGLYLLNLYRLPHDHEPVEQLGVPRLLFSLLFLALGFYLLPGLFKGEGGESQRPRGSVFAWVDAFLLQDPPEADAAANAMVDGKNDSADGQSTKRLTWLGNLNKGLKIAEEQKRLVFIDFTGLG